MAPTKSAATRPPVSNQAAVPRSLYVVHGRLLPIRVLSYYNTCGRARQLRSVDQHQRIEREDPFALGVDDHRVQVDLADRRAAGHDPADEHDQFGERGDVERGRPAVTLEQRGLLELEQPFVDRGLVEVGSEQLDVLEDLG